MKTNETPGGHAVVLMSYDSKGMRFLNSWGEGWADSGFFKVKDASVLGLQFLDVYWTLNDLKHSEKEAYELHAA